MATQITIVGLGPGDINHLSLGAWQALQSASSLWLRTEIHPTVDELRKQGIQFQTFDELYDRAQDFDSLYEEIVQRLLSGAGNGSITYAVPGHPLVAESTVTELLRLAEQSGFSVQIVPSMSCLDVIYSRVQIDPTDGSSIHDALDFPRQLDLNHYNLFTQVYSRLVGSELKLKLMNHYPDEHPVIVIRGAGIPNHERLASIELWELDSLDWLDHLTTVIVLPRTDTNQATDTNVAADAFYPLDPLVNVMERLRSETGCPWDREQTHRSLKRFFVEETYEVLEAIDNGDDRLLVEELGDVLMQIAFHAQIASERGAFDANDVVTSVTEKLIHRHPHVFGDVDVEDAEQVVVNWDKIKAEEKKEERTSILDGVPRHLPSLMEAEKIQIRAAKVGFDWEDVEGALEKIPEEVGEIIRAKDESGDVASEFGDLLFALTNVARHLGIDPEEALKMSTRKFINRFHYMESEVTRMQRQLSDMTFAEMDDLWEKAKTFESKNN